jgi:nucleotide-binding universal stress UspA family protein
MILIWYDGSPDARAAIAHAGELLRGQSAAVLTIWEPFLEFLARTPMGLGLAPGLIESDSIDDANRSAAMERATEGAELARQAGLKAEARTRSQATSVANAILAEADDLGASAVVMGSRGLTGLKSLLMGSVSHHVLQHADVTVIVVPSPQVAESRRRDRHDHGEE